MDYKITTDYKLVDIEKWEEFVKNHPNGNVFQTPEMYNVYKSEKYYEPILVVCNNSEDDIVGIVVSVIQREYKGLLGKLSSRSIIWGAPLVKEDNIEIFEILLKEYDIIVKHKAVYTQIRNLWNTDNFREIFEKHGYVYEEHLNILVDLTKSEDALWKDMYPKRRNEINKSEKLGVSVEIFNEANLVDNSYKIIREVYKRAKLPLPGKKYFESANNILGVKGYIKLFGAFYEGKLLGAMYLLCFNGRAYEWYIGSYFEYMKMHPNDLIVWKIFKWCKMNDYRIFDVGGAGKPGIEYGVREYKKKFGGSTENLGRYQKVYNRFSMSISTIGFKLWQLIKF
ncbi:MAG: peptidoglycan bridge formation glycyltransferase FemA/FemB family protein [Ignavibacteriae bacterium]|nr:peptidoglycan bridge formation glycyltransferase FemA/FemB family protein [Ignavibacteriota bacterium]